MDPPFRNSGSGSSDPHLEKVDPDPSTYFSNFSRVSDPDPDPHVFALPGSGSGQKGKEMNE